jgi:Protein of unknown function (DUF1614)
LGVPFASIGGAGTFDGIFLTGIMAVLLASFSVAPLRERRDRRCGCPQSWLFFRMCDAARMQAITA